MRPAATATVDGVTHTVRAVVQPEQSSKSILFVTSPANPLRSEDEARKTQFEDWGWTVNVIDDDASASEFDEAFTENDVVYVAENTSSSKVDEDLWDAPIGVVNEDSGLWYILGITRGYASGYWGNAIDVIDNSHYITQPFETGSLQITTSNQSLLYGGSRLGTGVVAIGERPSSNQAALATIDSGVTQWYRRPAPARRVSLPIAGSSFDWRTLTADGLTLIERSLDWAAGANAQALIAYENFSYDPTSNISAVGANGGTGWSGAWYGQANAVEMDGLTYQDLAVGGNKLVTPGGALASGRNIDTAPHGDLLVDDKFGKDNTTIWLSMLAEPGPDAGDTASTWARLILNDFWSGSGAFTGAPFVGIGQPWQSGRWGVDNDLYSPILSRVNVTEDAFIVVRIDFRRGDDWVFIWVNPTDLVNEPSYRNADAYGRVEDFTFDRIAITSGQNGSHGVGYGFDEIRIGRTWTSVSPQAPSDEQPQLVLLYEFNEVINEPQLLHDWMLDDDNTGGGSASGNTVTIRDDAFIDSYDSTIGAYGPGNINSGAHVATNSTTANAFTITDSGKIFGDAYVGEGGSPGSVISAAPSAITGQRSAMPVDAPMPAIGAPSGMPSSEGDRDVTGNETFDADRTFDDLTISGNAVVTISGNVRIRCRDYFTVSDSAQIIVPAGSTLSVYADDGMTIRDDARLNDDSTAPDRLYLYMLNTSGDLTIQNSAIVSAVLYSRDDLDIFNDTKVYGSITAIDDLQVTVNAQVHLDESLPAVIAPAANDDIASHDGFYVGATTAVIDPMGTVATFDGDDYVLIPHNQSMQLDEGTVSFWFRSDSLSGHRAIFSKDSSGYDTGGHFHVYTSGSSLYWRFQSSSSSYTLGASGLAVDTWYHVVATFGAGGMKLYLNGLLADSGSYAGGMGTSSGGVGNHEPLVLGAGTWGSGNLTHEPLSYYFRGAIGDVRIYRYGLDANQVANLNAGLELGPSSGPGTVITDTSGYGAAVNLDLGSTDNVTWLSGGGLHVGSENRAISSDAAQKLYDALTVTNQMTVEVVCQPDNTTQGGPARIVSYSDGAYARNFTVGTERQVYLTRLRTTTVSANGMPNVESGNVLTTNEQHLVVTYDGSNVKMYRDGVLEVTEPRTGSFANWDSDYRFMLFNEDGTSRDWLGTLKRVAVYDRALNDLQVDDVFNGSPPGDYSAGSESITSSVRWLESPP